LLNGIKHNSWYFKFRIASNLCGSGHACRGIPSEKQIDGIARIKCIAQIKSELIRKFPGGNTMRCDVCFACKPDKAARRSEIRACLSLTGTGNEYVTQAVRFENRYNLSFKYQNDQSWVRNDREMECIYDKLLPINMKLDGLAN